MTMEIASGSQSNAAPHGAVGGSIPYFADPSLRQRLDLLHHLVEYADLMLVVKGPHGAGKTALLDQLVGSPRDHWVVCRVDATPLTTRDQLLTLLTQQAGLNPPQLPVDQLEQALAEQLEILQKSGRVVLLVIDDAHALAAPVLGLLVRLHELSGENGKLLRVVLFAEPGLDEALRSPALRSLAQCITHTLDVPPFAREQSREFLEHALAHWESEAALPLAEQQVADAHEKSEGLPGGLLAAARELTQTAAADASTGTVAPPLSQRLLQPQSWVGAAVILLVLLALVFQDEINTLFESDQRPLVSADRPGQVELPLPPTGTEPRSTTDRPPAAPVGELPQVETEPHSDPPAKPSEATASTSAPSPGTSEQSTQPGMTESAAVPERPEPAAASAATERPQPSDGGTAPPDSARRPSAPGAGDSPLVAGVRGRDWILSQPRERLTLQLFGVREIDALREFVSDHELADQVSAFRTRYQGAPWYVLLYGSYPDRTEAEKARDLLAKTLGRVQPWPRTFGSIQEQLAEKRN